MPERILYPQFRDQFEPTTYPFVAKARLRNDAGDFLLEGTLLDAHLYPIGAKERMYLSKVVVEHGHVTIHIGDAYNQSLASGTFEVTDPPDHVLLTDDYNRPAGILVSQRQRLALFQTWGTGTHEFLLGDTEFASTCCMPMPEIGVRGLLLDDGTLFTGRVWILGEDGVVVRYSTMLLPAGCYRGLEGADMENRGDLLLEDGIPMGLDNSGTTEIPLIRVDIVGDPLFRRYLCEGENLFTTPNPIRKLRIRHAGGVFECPPNADGNFTIQMNDDLAANTVLRIRVDPAGIVFEAVGSVQEGT